MAAIEEARISYESLRPLATSLEKLAIPLDRPVLVLAGWADSVLSEDVADSARLLLRRVILPICHELDAVIISGGTNAGVMRMIGEAVSEINVPITLLGVAPRGCIKGWGARACSQGTQAAAEENHFLIGTDGEKWGDESVALVRIAEEIAGRRKPCVLVVGGGKGAAREVELAARRDWTVILATSSRGVARELEALSSLRFDSATQQRGSAAFGDTVRDEHRRAINASHARACRDDQTYPPPQPHHLFPVLRSLPSQLLYDVRCAQRDGWHRSAELTDRARIGRLVRWSLSDDSVLKEAWAQYSREDQLTAERKRPTVRLAGWVVLVGTLTVLATIAFAVRLGCLPSREAWATDPTSVILKGLATALPLVAGVLLGVLDRRSTRGSWINTRAVAEATIREIYRYRSGTGRYRRSHRPDLDFTTALAEIDSGSNGHARGVHLRQVDLRWPDEHLLTQVPSDDGLVSTLTAESYDAARVRHQLVYFNSAVADSGRTATKQATAAFVVSGTAAFALALSWQPALTLATPAAAALAAIGAGLYSWKQYRRLDDQADTMNLALVSLRTARKRWLAKPDPARKGRKAMRSYVSEAEAALEAEGAGWERRLRDSARDFSKTS